MDNSVHQELIEGHDPNCDHHQCDEDENDIDERNLIYILNAILSGTARLNILLPTATVLSFTIFTPLITNGAECSVLDKWFMGLFLAILAASCVFFSITDSFRTATGRLHYGMATLNGIWTFNNNRRRKQQPRTPSDYKLRWSDLFHASLSLIAFLTFAFSHSDALKCYYSKVPRKITTTVPLVTGFMISVLFVIFPSRRRGIGYPFLLQRDALRYNSNKC